MSGERAPCPLCRSRFDGLCHALDITRAELAELRIAQHRVDGPPIAKGAPSPTSATVRELRLELADARHQINELEKASRRWRDVAAAERSRAVAAEDAVARSYRAWLDIPAARHA